MATSTITLALPVIARARCTGCGLCEALCSTHAVEVRDGRATIVRPEDCSFCDICETYCPEGAIERPFSIVFAAEGKEGTQGAGKFLQPYNPDSSVE